MTDSIRNNEMVNFFDEALASVNEEALAQSTLLNDMQACTDRYTDMKEYKTGGSKTIYEAHDRMTDRKVAVAVLKGEPDITEIDSFIREARLNALLQHPNIVPVYDMGVNDKGPFFSMKFIAGNSLADILEGLKNNDEEYKKKYPLTALVDIFINICNGMSYAHSQGVLHLDLKPDNIRVDRFGDVLICDWGIAAVLDGHENVNDFFGSLENYSLNKLDLKNPTMDGYIKGTPGYMAPEQTGCTELKKGTWTDTFSLGCILYSILCCKTPFEGELEKLIANTLTGEFKKPSLLNPEVPSQLEAICLKAMSVHPDDRYADVESLHKDIMAYRNGYITSAEDFTLFKFMAFFIKRNKAVSAVSLAACSVLVIFTVYFIKSLNESRDTALNLAEKYRSENIEKVKRGAMLAEHFLEKSKNVLYERNYKDAMSYLESATRLDPGNKEAYFRKARIHCIEYEFEESLNAYEIAGKRDFLYTIAQKYKESPRPINIETKLKVIKDCFDHYGESRPVGDFMHNQIYYKDLAVNDRLKFAKGLLKMYNPEQKDIHFRYDKELQHLDISGNEKLSWAASLQNFPLKSLDISNTKLRNTNSLKQMKLQELNASHTGLFRLKFLDVTNLRYLNISHTGISKIFELKSSPIQILNLSHTKVQSLEPLKHMKYLRNLIIHNGQFSEIELAGLSKQVELTIVD